MINFYINKKKSYFRTGVVNECYTFNGTTWNRIQVRQGRVGMALKYTLLWELQKKENISEGKKCFSLPCNARAK